MQRREFLKGTLTYISLLPLTLLADSTHLHIASAMTQENHRGIRELTPADMPQRTLGQKHSKVKPLVISALAFGCMGLNYHRSKSLSQKEAANVVARAFEYGINFFDTAQVYGPDNNEILVGQILKPYKNKLTIATKFGFGKNLNELDSSPKRIRQVVEQSLKRLGLECLPLVYQHRFDPKTPIELVAQTIQELIIEGKVARWGVCELNAESIENAHRICPLTAVQIEYHLMWRNVESEIFPTLERLGIGFVAYSPLNRGYLSGKLTSNAAFDPKNDNRASFPRFQDDALRENYKIIELLQEFAKNKVNKYGKSPTPAQISLAYLLAKKPYIVPLFGTTNLEHLKEDVQSLDFVLDKDDLLWLDSKLDTIYIKGDRYPPKEANRVGL